MDEFEISGQLLGDRYAVVKKLGTSRLSTVFLAMDREGDGLVVVKVPRPQLLEDPGFRERYTDGMRDLFENPRPGVVKTLDTGTFVAEEGESVPVPYVVFEYLEGGSLEDRLSRGSMSPAEVLSWLPRVAKTLDSLHAEDILHRDVRPESILFDTEERPFLSDFAIAKALPNETGFTLPGGADDYGYTPPEVLSGTIGSAHDQYSLAAVVFRCVTGRRLFPHDPYLGVWNVLSTHLPGEAASVVEKALSVEPAERFGSCSEFAEALAEKVEGDETASSEEDATRAWTAPEIARKMDPAPQLRRGRTGMILVAIGAAAVLGVVGFFVLSGPGTDGGTTRVDPDPVVVGKEPPPDEPPPDEPPVVPPVAPSIVLNAPERATITRDARATVRGRVSGGNQVVVIVNETRVVPDDEGNFEFAMDLDEGSNTILVRWMDGEGNLGKLQSISVTRDGKAPALMVTSPDDGDLTSDGLTVLAGSLTDDNPAGVLVNGKRREIEKDGSFSFTFPLAEGENRFVVEAIDRAGNRAPVVTRVITKDGLAPELSIEAPTDAILTSGETVQVTGKAVDARLERLTVNGRPVEPRADGFFADAVGLEEGENVVTVVAVDAVGNETSAELRLTRDSTPPSVDVENPPAGFRTTESTVVVRGRLSDAHPAHVLVGGDKHELADGAFTVTVALEEGENAIEVVGLDRAGNRGETIRRSVVKDTRSPVLSVQAEPAWTTGDRTTITGTLDEDGCTVTVQGEPVEVEGRSFRTEVTVGPGLTEFVVEAADALGNGAVDNCEVSVLAAGDAVTGPRAFATRAGVLLTVAEGGRVEIQEGSEGGEHFELVEGAIEGEIGSETLIDLPFGTLTVPKGRTVAVRAEALGHTGTRLILLKGRALLTDGDRLSVSLAAGQGLEIQAKENGLSFGATADCASKLYMFSQLTPDLQAQIWIAKGARGTLIRSGTVTRVSSDPATPPEEEFKVRTIYKLAAGEWLQLPPGAAVKIQHDSARIERE